MTTTTASPEPPDNPDDIHIPGRVNGRTAWPTWRDKARRRRQTRKSRARAAQQRHDLATESRSA